MPVASDPNALLREVVRILDRERDSQGYTQRQLGDRSGIAQSTVSKYMSMKLPLSVSQFDAMCSALGLNPGEVMVEADRMRNAS